VALRPCLRDGPPASRAVHLPRTSLDPTLRPLGGGGDVCGSGGPPARQAGWHRDRGWGRRVRSPVLPLSAPSSERAAQPQARRAGREREAGLPRPTARPPPAPTQLASAVRLPRRASVRRTARWASATLCVVLAGLWLLSGWRHQIWYWTGPRANWRLDLIEGRLEFYLYNDRGRPPLTVDTGPDGRWLHEHHGLDRWQWRPEWGPPPMCPTSTCPSGRPCCSWPRPRDGSGSAVSRWAPAAAAAVATRGPVG
jgi:hypothetical protein